MTRNNSLMMTGAEEQDGCGTAPGEAQRDDHRDQKTTTIAKAIVFCLAANPIEERADVFCGLEVQGRLAETDLGDFERTKIEVLAYLIREPLRVDTFMNRFVDTRDAWTSLEAAEAVNLAGAERHLPARTQNYFSPAALQRLVDPAREEKKFDDLVRRVVFLDMEIARASAVVAGAARDEAVGVAVDAVMFRAGTLKGFSGEGSYHTEHLVRDRFVKAGAAFPGKELLPMGKDQEFHFGELRDLFGDLNGFVGFVGSLKLPATPFLDLGRLRYAICMIHKFVGGRHVPLLDVARSFLGENTTACDDEKEEELSIPASEEEELVLSSSSSVSTVSTDTTDFVRDAEVEVECASLLCSRCRRTDAAGATARRRRRRQRRVARRRRWMPRYYFLSSFPALWSSWHQRRRSQTHAQRRNPQSQ